MALKKEIKTRSGFSVSYWKITDWKINQTAKSMDITLTPYISSQTRQDGYDPVRDEVLKVRATDYYVKEGSLTNRTNYPDYFSPTALENAAKEGRSIYQVMYDYIKEHQKEFVDAEDI